MKVSAIQDPCAQPRPSPSNITNSSTPLLEKLAKLTTSYLKNLTQKPQIHSNLCEDTNILQNNRVQKLSATEGIARQEKQLPLQENLSYRIEDFILTDETSRLLVEKLIHYMTWPLKEHPNRGWKTMQEFFRVLPVDFLDASFMNDLTDQWNAENDSNVCSYFINGFSITLLSCLKKGNQEQIKQIVRKLQNLTLTQESPEKLSIFLDNLAIVYAFSMEPKEVFQLVKQCTKPIIRYLTKEPMNGLERVPRVLAQFSIVPPDKSTLDFLVDLWSQYPDSEGFGSPWSKFINNLGEVIENNLNIGYQKPMHRILQRLELSIRKNRNVEDLCSSLQHQCYGLPSDKDASVSKQNTPPPASLLLEIIHQYTSLNDKAFLQDLGTSLYESTKEGLSAQDCFHHLLCFTRASILVKIISQIGLFSEKQIEIIKKTYNEVVMNDETFKNNILAWSSHKMKKAEFAQMILAHLIDFMTEEEKGDIPSIVECLNHVEDDVIDRFEVDLQQTAGYQRYQFLQKMQNIIHLHRFSSSFIQNILCSAYENVPPSYAGIGLPNHGVTCWLNAGLQVFNANSMWLTALQSTIRALPALQKTIDLLQQQIQAKEELQGIEQIMSSIATHETSDVCKLVKNWMMHAFPQRPQTLNEWQGSVRRLQMKLESLQAYLPIFSALETVLILLKENKLPPGQQLDLIRKRYEEYKNLPRGQLDATEFVTDLLMEIGEEQTLLERKREFEPEVDSLGTSYPHESSTEHSYYLRLSVRDLFTEPTSFITLQALCSFKEKMMVSSKQNPHKQIELVSSNLITQWPEHLCIHIDRTAINERSEPYKIDAPLVDLCDVSKIQIHGLESTKSYRLISAICHENSSNSIDFGHYYMIRQEQSGTVLYNDEQVRLLTPQEAVQKMQKASFLHLQKNV